MNNILTIISCHTDSNIKIDALTHNIKYFMEISDTIAIVNSLEFIHLNIKRKIMERYFNKNIIFDDILTDKLCYIYKKKYNDLRNLSNEQLREHWIRHGKREKRDFSCKVYNIYFDYKINDKFINHGKWLYFLNKINYSIYNNIILTNDSFVITRSLISLKTLIEPSIELVSLLNSYENQYHYPDFLRIYNLVGLNKIIKYYEMTMPKITDFNSCINDFEIKSSDIFDSVKVLYKGTEDFKGNIHFDDKYLEDYLYNKNYPVVKIKKLLTGTFEYKNIPRDFNSNQYKRLHHDLVSFTDRAAFEHFKNYGMREGRMYKKNQSRTLPTFLKNYMNLSGFNL
jgi:hypothetical protein